MDGIASVSVNGKLAKIGRGTSDLENFAAALKQERLVRRAIMKHELHRVKDFSEVGPYTLKVIFDDNTEQIINFEPVLWGYYLEPLRNPKMFAAVRLDPEIHTLVWPNDAAFDPATLYHWNAGEGEELAARARGWRERRPDAA